MSRAIVPEPRAQCPCPRAGCGAGCSATGTSARRDLLCLMPAGHGSLVLEKRLRLRNLLLAEQRAELRFNCKMEEKPG